MLSSMAECTCAEPGRPDACSGEAKSACAILVMFSVVVASIGISFRIHWPWVLFRFGRRRPGGGVAHRLLRVAGPAPRRARPVRVDWSEPCTRPSGPCRPDMPAPVATESGLASFAPQRSPATTLLRSYYLE